MNNHIKQCLSILALAVAWTVCMADIPGGEVKKPGTGVKSIAIVNTQSRLPHEDIVKVASMLEKQTMFVVRPQIFKEEDPLKLFGVTGSDIVIVVKDKPSDPTLLLAPEDHWCVVNVSKLVDDLPSDRAKEKFFPSRARKEIIKGFSLLCGGGSSQFPQNIMNTATVRELDLALEQVPMDMVNYYTRYLERLGFKAKVVAPYEFACEEGWAPAPTNDVQKAIWEKVHTPPTKPIKISYDKDKQKPVVK